MALYRASEKDGPVWITGASSGIGRELALRLATMGWTVAATARRREDLEQLAAEALTGKGRIVAFPCDVTDRAKLADTIESIEKNLGPIALAVFNAGTFFPAEGDDIDLDQFEKTFQLNLLGALNGLVPLVARMKKRGQGQIAITGSVSAYVGLPSASAYGASKAAVNYVAESLKHDLDALNIRIQVINPGFVETPLTKKNEFPMPGIMPADKAAVIIADGLTRGGFEITFPRRLSWPLKFARTLPFGLRFWLIHKATQWDKHIAERRNSGK